MRDGAMTLAETTVIEPPRGPDVRDLAALWRHREILYFLVWRDLKLRYRQTAVGAAWLVLQPLLTVAVISVFFGRFVGVPSEGVPYPLLALTGLLPWLYVSQAVALASTSLVADQALLSRVYFPRLMIPLARIARSMLDLLLALLLLVATLVLATMPVGARLIALPLALLFAAATALALGVWLAPLNVAYRDIGNAIPFLTQLWMFASPVAYPTSVIPDAYRALYGLNPLAGVVETFRAVLLPGLSIDVRVIVVSLGTTLVLLVVGATRFLRAEPTLADRL